MTFEQVERHHVDELWLTLESRQHIGREAGRRVPLTRDPFADVAAGVEQVGADRRSPRPSPTRRPYGYDTRALAPHGP